jgi:DNA repair protein RadC
MPARRRIHQLPAADRPREKLQRKGVRALSDFELLEALVGSGAGSSDVGKIARRLQRLLEKNSDDLTYDTLATVQGVGPALATKILASLELAQRYLLRNVEPLRTKQDIMARLDALRTKLQEHFVCLTLDGGQRLVAQRTITIGTLDAVQAHPREVFADAIADRAASIVVAHNHPSGQAYPTQKDIELTQQLKSAGVLLGVTLRDHFILTKTDHYSFDEHHLLL